MTWFELYHLLDREIEGTDDAIAGRMQGLPEPPAEEDAGQQQLAVNEACEHFAHYRTWPRLDPAASWELDYRLLECRQFARFVAQPELSRRGADCPFPDEKLLRWVLIDYWAFAGIWRRIYGLEGGAPSTA